jgi:hypothetical protein
MALKLQIKECEDATKLLEQIYEELAKEGLSDGEIAEHVQFMWYNVNSKQYEAIYLKTIE